MIFKTPALTRRFTTSASVSVSTLVRRRLGWLGVVSAAAAAVFGLPHGAHAVAPAQVYHRQSAMIPRAVGVYVTPRGQRYFDEKLLELIARHGYDLSDGGFEGWSYRGTEPIRLDQLPVRMRPFAGTLGTVRDIIQKWLLNAQVQDPLINAELKTIQFSAQFRHFGLRVDTEATARTMGGRGVVIVFEAEVPSLRVELDNVRATDVNNPELFGQFGADKPWTTLTPTSAPLRVTIPMSLQLEHGSGLRFEMLGLETNLADVDLDLDFKHPLLLPRVRLLVNGHPFTLNQAHLEKEILAHKHELLKAAQAFISGYATENSPTEANRLVSETYSDLLLSDVNEMDPPGATLPTTDKDRYLWGVTPEELSYQNGFLALGLSAFVEDPLARQPGAEVSRRLVTQPPRLSVVDPATYDAAIAISEDMVNRILGMGYLRGYYPTLDVSGSKPLQVLQAPEFRFTGASASNHGKLHLKVKHRVEGFTEAIAIRREVTFEMDVNARLVHTAQGQVSVVVDSVDTQSLNVDLSTVHSMFRGKVRDSLLKNLQDTNRDLAKKPKVIVDSLPIPSQVGGIPIKVKDFRSDANGYLVLYTEFDSGN